MRNVELLCGTFLSHILTRGTIGICHVGNAKTITWHPSISCTYHVEQMKIVIQETRGIFHARKREMGKTKYGSI
jgi:hypothetical protein